MRQQSDLAKSGRVIALIAVTSFVYSLAGAAGSTDQEFVDALAGGNVARVEQLLAEGYDINHRFSNQMTPIMVAALGGSTVTIKLLADKGADVNASGGQGLTALYLAAQNGRAVAAEALLDAGADINAVAAAGATSLMIASQSGHVDVVDVLLDNGGWMRRWFRPTLELNKATVQGATAVAIAYSEGHWEIVNRLIDAGAEQGDVAIYVAILRNDRAEAEALISQGLDINKEVFGTSALVEAVRWGRVEIVRLLLDSGVDVSREHYGGGEFVRLISTAKVLAKGKLTLLEEAETRPEALHGLSPQLLKAFLTGGGIDEMREIVRLLEEAEAP